MHLDRINRQAKVRHWTPCRVQYYLRHNLIRKAVFSHGVQGPSADPITAPADRMRAGRAHLEAHWPQVQATLPPGHPARAALLVTLGALMPDLLALHWYIRLNADAASWLKGHKQRMAALAQYLRHTR